MALGGRARAVSVPVSVVCWSAHPRRDSPIGQGAAQEVQQVGSKAGFRRSLCEGTWETK